jgi:hypothetical protein
MKKKNSKNKDYPSWGDKSKKKSKPQLESPIPQMKSDSVNNTSILYSNCA